MTAKLLAAKSIYFLSDRYGYKHIIALRLSKLMKKCYQLFSNVTFVQKERVGRPAWNAPRGTPRVERPAWNSAEKVVFTFLFGFYLLPLVYGD
jgi:hypothetical protein